MRVCLMSEIMSVLVQLRQADPIVVVFLCKTQLPIQSAVDGFCIPQSPTDIGVLSQFGDFADH